MKILKTRRTLATVMVAASAAIGVVVPASPASAACHWTVIWQTAGVYEAARSNSAVLKTKYLGQVVGPYCDQYPDAYRPGENMVLVHCDCATNHNGYAFMRRNALRLN